MVHKSVYSGLGAAVLLVLAAVVFSMTTHGVHSTRIATSYSEDSPSNSSANSSTLDLIAKVTIIKTPVTHHAHPIRAAILLLAALALVGLTVTWARSNATEAS